MKDEYYMNLALKEAKKAYKIDEVPIGCVIVKDDVVLARAYNMKEIRKIASYHAEVLAINRACKKEKSWHLDGCTLYTTIEPCMMCMGAILQSRISRVVYGASNDAFGYLRKVSSDKIEILSGVLEKDCQLILSNFFKKKRC